METTISQEFFIPANGQAVESKTSGNSIVIPGGLNVQKDIDRTDQDLVV